MSKNAPTPDEIAAAIKDVAAVLGRRPARSEFISRSGVTEYQILSHFESWNAAVRAAGFDPDETNLRADDQELLTDWAALVRTHRRIPTRHQYRREGSFSPGVFDRHFGAWSGLPAVFKSFAQGRPEWADVVALLPVAAEPAVESARGQPPHPDGTGRNYAKLDGRPTYGDPIDFRGLRHAPVNEDGVVFLFGMVARELGYLVEAVQAGFPDCEAKRQIGPGQWQRIRIEFEYESRNFRDHGHPVDGCDVIICWRHNWLECPPRLEVVELESVIRSLAQESE